MSKKSKNIGVQTSLGVEWLGLCTPMQEAWVRSLVGELNPVSHKIPYSETKTRYIQKKKRILEWVAIPSSRASSQARQ